MNIKNKILTGFKSALLDRDQIKKNILGEIKTEILLFEKVKGEISDAEVISIIEKSLKRVKSTIDTCPQGRNDVLEQCEIETEILEDLLPRFINKDELDTLIKEYIKNNDINPKEFISNKGLFIKTVSELAIEQGLRVDKSYLAVYKI